MILLFLFLIFFFASVECTNPQNVAKIIESQLQSSRVHFIRMYCMYIRVYSYVIYSSYKKIIWVLVCLRSLSNNRDPHIIYSAFSLTFYSNMYLYMYLFVCMCLDKYICKRFISSISSYVLVISKDESFTVFELVE